MWAVYSANVPQTLKLNQYSVQLGQIRLELCDFPGFPSEGRNSQCNQQELLSIKHKCWTIHPGHLLLPFLVSNKQMTAGLDLTLLSYMWSSVLYNKEENSKLLASIFYIPFYDWSIPLNQATSYALPFAYTTSCFSISLPSSMKILIDIKFSIACILILDEVKICGIYGNICTQLLASVSYLAHKIEIYRISK